jgi:hypothetical protein
MATKIMACNCKHAFQNERYGIGQRVFNSMVSDNSFMYRCTVCKNEKKVS